MVFILRRPSEPVNQASQIRPPPGVHSSRSGEFSLGLTGTASKPEPIDASAVAAQVRKTPRRTAEFTCLGEMFHAVAGSVIPVAPVAAERIVVDVSGAGIDNCTDPKNLRAAQVDLLSTGVAINGLPILVPGENDVVGVGAYQAPGYGLCAPPLPQERVGLEQWYRDHVVGGPGAFLLTVSSYRDFARALRRKFVIAVSDIGHSALDR